VTDPVAKFWEEAESGRLMENLVRLASDPQEQTRYLAAKRFPNAFRFDGMEMDETQILYLNILEAVSEGWLKICPSCNAHGHWKQFCGACGEKIVKTVKEYRVCVDCGERSEHMYCPGCGAVLFDEELHRLANDDAAYAEACRIADEEDLNESSNLEHQAERRFLAGRGGQEDHGVTG